MEYEIEHEYTPKDILAFALITVGILGAFYAGLGYIESITSGLH